MTTDTDRRVDWDTLKAWCLAHGAKNEHITYIQIDGRAEEFNVILEGNELRDGKPFNEGLRDGVAKWRTVEPLRYLP